MPRTEVFQLRLSTSEKAQLARMAEERGMSIANLVRERVLGRSFPDAPTRSKSDEITIAYLTTQLKSQGMTTPVARREARKRLGL